MSSTKDWLFSSSRIWIELLGMTKPGKKLFQEVNVRRCWWRVDLEYLWLEFLNQKRFTSRKELLQMQDLPTRIWSRITEQPKNHYEGVARNIALVVDESSPDAMAARYLKAIGMLRKIPDVCDDPVLQLFYDCERKGDFAKIAELTANIGDIPCAQAYGIVARLQKLYSPH